jgi:hypothetical protein
VSKPKREQPRYSALLKSNGKLYVNDSRRGPATRGQVITNLEFSRQNHKRGEAIVDHLNRVRLEQGDAAAEAEVKRLRCRAELVSQLVGLELGVSTRGASDPDVIRSMAVHAGAGHLSPPGLTDELARQLADLSDVEQLVRDHAGRYNVRLRALLKEVLDRYPELPQPPGGS